MVFGVSVCILSLISIFLVIFENRKRAWIDVGISLIYHFVASAYVQGRTLDELYMNALIYCLPSDLESALLSLPEGMSYGNCCLVSDIPECAEIFEDKVVTL